MFIGEDDSSLRDRRSALAAYFIITTVNLRSKGPARKGVPPLKDIVVSTKFSLIIAIFLLWEKLEVP